MIKGENVRLYICYLSDKDKLDTELRRNAFLQQQLDVARGVVVVGTEPPTLITKVAPAGFGIPCVLGLEP